MRVAGCSPSFLRDLDYKQAVAKEQGAHTAALDAGCASGLGISYAEHPPLTHQLPKEGKSAKYTVRGPR